MSLDFQEALSIIFVFVLCTVAIVAFMSSAEETQDVKLEASVNLFTDANYTNDSQFFNKTTDSDIVYRELCQRFNGSIEQVESSVYCKLS